MIGPFVQITVMVALTHGFRALERRVGPRRSGLLMGLPSTTALTLVGCGLERGVEEATLASEACLIGLVAATSLPISYAKAVAAGMRVPRAAGSAILIYLVIAAGLWWLPRAGPWASVLIAMLGLGGACHLAGRVSRLGDGLQDDSGRMVAGRCTLAARTAVPVVYVGVIRSVRAALGSTWSGRFITFPGGSLALLVTTHLERGPAPAFRMAVAMPAGGLGTLGFLLAFRFGSPELGLGWGTAAGYATALLALISAERLGRPVRWPESIGVRLSFDAWTSRLKSGTSLLRTEVRRLLDYQIAGRRLTTRQFSPGLEALTG